MRAGESSRAFAQTIFRGVEKHGLAKRIAVDKLEPFDCLEIGKRQKRAEAFPAEHTVPEDEIPTPKGHV